MNPTAADRAAFAAEVAMIAPEWTIAGRTYSAADVFEAVDPDGYAVMLADFIAEREAPRAAA